MNTDARAEDRRFINNLVEAALRIGLIFLLVFWAFLIVKPFVMPVVWGAILAVALMPVTQKLEGMLGGRRKTGRFSTSTTHITSALTSRTTCAVFLTASAVKSARLYLTQPGQSFRPFGMTFVGLPRRLKSFVFRGSRISNRVALWSGCSVRGYADGLVVPDLPAPRYGSDTRARAD